MKDFYRTYAQVDLAAIRHNIAEVRKNIKPETKIMAIIKADGYGHGAIPVAKTLGDQVDAYGVALIEEALKLREAGFDKLILILGFTGEEWFEELVKNNISQTVFDYDTAVKLNHAAGKVGRKAKIHIKVDTGMSRIGFTPTEENVETAAKIAQLPNIEVEGAFTHFARADEEDITPAKEPFEKYMWFVTELEKRGVTIPIKHVSNSASIIAFPEANLNMVRSGITTYGIYPSHEVTQDVLKLQPAMEWKATVSFVKEVEPGTAISYGGTFVASQKMKVATIPVGYADGMKRDLSNKGCVLIMGKRVPIIGRICMDQFMVDVTGMDVKPGTPVTIMGKDENEMLSVEEVSEAAHSFSYEFVCGITDRVPRKYVNK